MKKVILFLVSILLICLAYSFAAVPCKINYQGRLIKDNVPVDGTKKMNFSIYNDLEFGDRLWTSEDVSVEVHNGLFRYVIGSGEEDLSGIFQTAGQTLYLEVIVAGEKLTPREELSAYPYAINSHLLEGATKEYFLNTSAETQRKDGGLNIMGNVGIGTTGPSTLFNVYKSFGGSGGGGATVTRVEGQFVPDTNYNLLDLVHGGTTLMRVQANGNVGIGTTSPGAKLEVQGGLIKATGGLIIETRTSDPDAAAAVTGQIWLRTDIP